MNADKIKFYFLEVSIMFCPNCGKELPNGSQFCPACGKPVTAEAISSTKAFDFSHPQLAKTSLKTLIPMSLMLFFFGFLNWVSVDLMGFKLTLSAVRGHAFSLDYLGDWACGIAKILVIISYVLIALALASSIFSFESVMPKYKGKNVINRFFSVLYYVVYLLALIFSMIGVFVMNGKAGMTVAHCGFDWWVSLVLTLVGLVLAFVPSILDKILAKLNPNN